MANSSSCSHWWHAPFYLAMSLALVFMSITVPNHSRPDNPSISAHLLALNASRALRVHGGFNAIAAMLQVSPELFISGQESTVFAIQDSAFSNLSIPAWAMRQLLSYHTTPSSLPTAEIFKKPNGFCFKTLLQNKNLILTENDAITGLVSINGVIVSHPDIFLEGPFSVHGVLRPFEAMQSSDPCNNPPVAAGSFVSDSAGKVEWATVVRFLSSHGFVSFAIGLNSVLDEIVKDYGNLSTVTIFAPPNSGFISSPSPLLDRIVRLHILPLRFTYMELLAAGKSSLKTLFPGYSLKTDKFSDFKGIKGVEITEPDFFLSDKIVIHGLSETFDYDDFSTSL